MMKTVSRTLILLFILLLPTQLGKYFFFDFSYLSGVRVDYLAPTLFLTDILALSIIIINFSAILSDIKNKWIIIIAGYATLNILFALSPPLALYKWIKIAEIFSIYIAIKNSKPSMPAINVAFFLGSLFELVLAVLQLSQKQSIQQFFYYFGERAFTFSTPGIAKAAINGVEFLRPYGTFSHPNSMGGFYLLMYFYFLTQENFSIPFKKKDLALYVKYSSMFTTAALVFLSFSKIAILTLAVLTIAYLWRVKFYAACRFCFFARICVLAVISAVVLLVKADPLTVAKRIELLKNAFMIIATHPIFGVGAGNYVVAQNEFSSHFLNFLNQPVHNIFVLMFAEHGIIFSVFTIFFLFNYVKKNIKNNTFLFLVLAVFVTGVFDHYWLTLQQNILLIPVIFALIRKDVFIKKANKNPRQ